MEQSYGQTRSAWILIRSCVIIFSTGVQYRWFHGLKHTTRDSIAVNSHARPYQFECSRTYSHQYQDPSTAGLLAVALGYDAYEFIEGEQ